MKLTPIVDSFVCNLHMFCFLVVIVDLGDAVTMMTSFLSSIDLELEERSDLQEDGEI